MYLRLLELQGFKTFANKTILEFSPDTKGRRGLTAIVGPNGSGKSNIADAVRWVMGEQSLKLLRGKKSEDVIFSGSQKKSRSGFAEVSLTLVNDDLPDRQAGKPDIDLPEIVITRRVYRDGQSEYEVNKQAVRLADIVLLLAQAGIGQRTYSVIGQGMVDSVLIASPTERKEFFDEAAGLKPFQLKRQSSVNKLAATKDNLKQAELLLREIAPRLSSLERQAKRLQQRDELEQKLSDLERVYYGGQWADLRAKLNAAASAVFVAKEESGKRAVLAEKLEAELRALEKAEPPSEGFKELRRILDNLKEERGKLRERQLRLETSKEVALARSEKAWAPLPLSKIIKAIDELNKKYDELWEALEADRPDMAKVKKMVENVRTINADLLSKLQRPAPEPAAAEKSDSAAEKEAQKLVAEMQRIEGEIKTAEKRLDDWNRDEEGKRSHIFELQHKLTDVRHAASKAGAKANEAEIELARLETRREAFYQDLRTHAPKLEKTLEAAADALQVEKFGEAPETLVATLNRLRSQLEWIGGIDPEVLKEYEETKDRFEKLAVQTEDLKQALVSLETIISELDKTIKERSETSFRLMDREFGLFFKKLFGGGEARLLEIAPEPEIDEEGNVIKEVEPDAGPVGIEIQATPPGKRMKSVALLSGGERALTSIALICAIMATNPSPFVVLDEVDAALDEANSKKFAEIVIVLAEKTQFIVVTHNRATMQEAHVLYGVTMGDNGVSQLLSVKIDDAIGKTSKR
ncbi:AAA family ATPase [Patescibacteria group bacterium]|nr:AAA family ATPase [Patescibacteria group bacterium]